MNMASEDTDINSEISPDEGADSKPVDKVSKELANIRKRRNYIRLVIKEQKKNNY